MSQAIAFYVLSTLILGFAVLVVSTRNTVHAVLYLVLNFLAVAALYVCIARMLYRLRRANLSWRTYPVFLLEENRWRAQRYGVQGSLFDFGKGALVPFRDLVEEILALVAEDAAALGCGKQIAHARKIVAEGTSADRQVAAMNMRLAAGATRQEALQGVVDDLIAETMAVD